MSSLLFSTLHDRLIELLRGRVRNGETTERSLAKMTGISQPHVHNVLKGEKMLSAELADVVLQRLHLSVLDLLSQKEVADFLAGHAPADKLPVPVPVLQGFLGPGHPLPAPAPDPEFHPVPPGRVSGLVAPVIVRLAEDPEMTALYQEGAVVLLDRSEAARRFLHPQGHYVVLTALGPRVRAVRRRDNTLFLVSEINKKVPEKWQALALNLTSLLDLVAARVIWLEATV